MNFFLGQKTGFCEMQLPEWQHQCAIDLKGWNIGFDHSPQILVSRNLKTLSLLKYDAFQALFERLGTVIKILLPTISLDCNYLQILSI